MERIARRLAGYLVSAGKLPEEKKEMIRYGLEICISTLGVLISILILSVGLFQKLDGIVFTWFFTSVRLFSGGFHASTYTKCYLCSLTTFVCVAFAAKFLLVNNLWIQWGMIAGCYAWIYSKSPLINPNHPISEEAVHKNKKNLEKVMLLNLILFYFIAGKSLHYGSVAFWTTAFVGITFWMAEKNVEKKIEKIVSKIRR